MRRTRLTPPPVRNFAHRTVTVVLQPRCRTKRRKDQPYRMPTSRRGTSNLPGILRIGSEETFAPLQTLSVRSQNEVRAAVLRAAGNAVIRGRRMVLAVRDGFELCRIDAIILQEAHDKRGASRG